MAKLPESVTIIGTGALGGALKALFDGLKIPVRSLWNSRGGSLFDESGNETSLSGSFPESDLETGMVVFITTPDAQIRSTSEKLSQTEIKWKGRSVVHCSGALASDELQPLRKSGASTASMHPIQTFRKGDDASRFREITTSLEGDESLTASLEELVIKMGANPLKADRDMKKAIHLSAVVASNYLVALLNVSQEILRDAGVNGDIRLLEPLIRQTLENVLTKGTAASLSGPISRGDEPVVRHQFSSLSDDLQKQKLYGTLGIHAVDLARKAGTLSEQEAARLKEILRPEG